MLAERKDFKHELICFFLLSASTPQIFFALQSSMSVFDIGSGVGQKSSKHWMQLPLASRTSAKIVNEAFLGTELCQS